MAREATLSILGLYNWDNTIFDLMELPEGLEKQTCIDNIISRFAELEILYPNPVIMKNLIGVWSRTSQYEWNKLAKTLDLEYDPIANYDRKENRTLNTHGAGTSKNTGSDTSQTTGQGTEKVNGFNASLNMVNRARNDTNNNGSITYGKKTDETFDKEDTETIRAYGNIGVTTTQQMMQQERDIAKFNLYDIIAEEFKLRFCILVY